MKQITLTPIAYVKNIRKEPIDDHWQKIESTIILDENLPLDIIEGLDSFSHLEIIYYFNKVEDNGIVYSSRPRGNPNYPLVGIFAQRKKERPNKLGLSTVEIISIEGRNIKVKFLDAIDGTPIVDIKPVFKKFQPIGEVKEPNWVSDLMSNYW